MVRASSDFPKSTGPWTMRIRCLLIAVASLGLVAGTIGAIQYHLRRSSWAESHSVPSFSRQSVAQVFSALPLRFEENQGQADARVRFLARAHASVLFLTESGASLLYLSPATAPGGDESKSEVLRVKLVGSNRAPEISGLERLPGRSNYFVGNNPRRWRVNVPAFAQVRCRAVYPGINLVYYGNQGRLEYDFELAPGTSPRVIAMGFEGARGVEVRSTGELSVRMTKREVIVHRPLAYQLVRGVRRMVPACFESRGAAVVGFAVGPYDSSKPLIIDPVLTYSTYLGGSGVDQGKSVAVDASGNIYVAGATTSSDFPTTVGVVQSSLNGGNDVFVTKLDPNGGALVYSTYLGGSGDEQATHIAIDSAGNSYVTGVTGSTNFPTTLGALQTSLLGSNDAFVVKLDSTGTALVYSTYLGGSDVDLGNSIAVDSSGNVYLVGQTVSTDFPISAGAFQTTPGGNGDAFVTKLSGDGATLVYSTLLGGSASDQGTGIAVDAAGAAYVTGTTSSTDFPTTNPLQAAIAGSSDAFVTEVSPDGTSLIYSTFLGGTDSEAGADIVLDSSQDAFVTGTTNSTDFPVLSPYQAANAGGSDGFITKINAGGSALRWSTYLGGSGQDVPRAMALDSSGNVYVVGQTGSANFPKANPLQSYLLATDAFVTELDAGGATLLFSTLLGGSGQERASAVAVDSAGNVYVTGLTDSPDFPTLAGSLQTSTAGGVDAFVVKAAPADQPALNFAPTALTFPDQSVNTISLSQNVLLRNMGSAALTIASVTVSGDFVQTNNCFGTVPGGSKCTVSVSFAPIARGSRTGTLTIADNASGSPHTITLTGNGIAPAVTLSANSLTFADQGVGTTSAPQTVGLTNTGVDPLTINGFAIIGDFTQTNNCGLTVAAGSSCAIQVSFRPTMPLARTGSLSIVHNAPGSPNQVQLSGTGVGPAVKLSSTDVVFGEQPVGTTSGPQTVALTNTGNAPLTIAQVTASGDFTQTNDCGSPLGAGAACTLSISFRPTTAGTTFGAIAISDNAPGNPHVVTLSGQAISGTAPEAYLSPRNLAFGLQPVTTNSSPQTVTVTNTGNAPLTISKVEVTSGFSQTNDCTTVAAGSSCTITTTFTPILRGAQTGTLTVANSASGSPHTAILTGTGTDFALAVSPASLTVNAGEATKYTLTITPLNGFNLGVSAACTGAPQATSCSVTPQSLTLDGSSPATVTVDVKTTARSSLPPSERKEPSGPLRVPSPIAGWLLFLCASVLIARLAVRRRRRLAWLLVTTALAVALWGACSVSNKISGTPPGRFSLTLDVTANVNGSTLTRSTTVQLNVN
jgi:hypothetical protein